MATRLTESPHGALGLDSDDLLGMHRTMLTARLLDEAAFRQNRMGRAPFVVPVSGHEGCQIGTAWPMRRGTDIWLPYYRDLGVVLVAGMTPHEVFLGIFATVHVLLRPGSGYVGSTSGEISIGVMSLFVAFGVGSVASCTCGCRPKDLNRPRSPSAARGRAGRSR